MTNAVKPLPCPFCGTEARIIQAETMKIQGRHMRPYMIGCSDPDCILYLDVEGREARLMFAESTAEEDIIARWNKRSPADDEEVQVDE